MARKTYKLDHATKGTGASVVPIGGEDGKPAAEEPRKLPTIPLPREERPRPAAEPKRTFLTPLPPGHVRKKSTGELGKVRALDPKAGTVTVAWLKSGMTSTVPLASVTRR
jgi:hypothetical protein